MFSPLQYSQGLFREALVAGYEKLHACHEVGEAIKHVYFPRFGMISLLAVM